MKDLLHRVVDFLFGTTEHAVITILVAMAIFTGMMTSVGMVDAVLAGLRFFMVDIVGGLPVLGKVLVGVVGFFIGVVGLRWAWAFLQYVLDRLMTIEMPWNKQA